MKKFTVMLFSMLLILSSCEDDFDEQGQLDVQLDRALENLSGKAGRTYFTLPESDDLARIPQDSRNPLTAEKVALGRFLYHETGLAVVPKKSASRNTYSCASCHAASAGFQAGRQQGIGEGGLGFGTKGKGRFKSVDYIDEELDVQPIRSPSALNVAYQEQMLWNGQFGATARNVGTEYAWKAGTPIETNFLGYEGVETQAIAGLTVHRMDIDVDFLQKTGYAGMFDRAFPDFPPAERYSRITAGLAIAAYERTLLANQSPWQQWLKGDPLAMTEQEKRGAILFFTKGECGQCHTGPALSANKFFAYGMKDLDVCPEPVFAVNAKDPVHLGRGGFTQRPEDMYKFKVPQLYNLKYSPFLGHGSSFGSVEQVVEYKNEGIPENSRVPAEQLAVFFRPLDLSEEEIDAITDFIENALYDPNLMRYQPDHLPSGFCFPNNDPEARVDLGCN